MTPEQENMIEKEVNGFFIVSKGDPTVGIYSAEWQLTGGFIFGDKDELDKFREDLRQFFADNVSDDVYIETFEERQEWVNELDKPLNNK